MFNHVIAPILISVTIVAGLIAALTLLLRHLRRRLREGRISDPNYCRKCGYDASHLTVPRCPECGSALGFVKTFSELGIDEAEVIRYTDSRRAERGGDSDTPSSDDG